MSSTIERTAIQFAHAIKAGKSAKKLLSKLVKNVDEIEGQKCNDEYRTMAKEQYDDDAVVSPSNSGAYVAAWVWVDRK